MTKYTGIYICMGAIVSLLYCMDMDLEDGKINVLKAGLFGLFWWAVIPYLTIKYSILLSIYCVRESIKYFKAGGFQEDLNELLKRPAVPITIKESNQSNPLAVVQYEPGQWMHNDNEKLVAKN